MVGKAKRQHNWHIQKNLANLLSENQANFWTLTQRTMDLRKKKKIKHPNPGCRRQQSALISGRSPYKMEKRLCWVTRRNTFIQASSTFLTTLFTTFLKSCCIPSDGERGQ